MFLSRNEIADHQWNDFVAASPQGCIYHCTWYLDVVCPNWSAIVIGNKQHWNAVMPLPMSQKMGVTYALQPQFAQYSGVLFRPQEGKQLTQWNNKKRWCEAIVKHIPTSIKLFKFTFAPQFDYPLPFYWRDYQLEVKYTYWLSLEATAKELEEGFDKSVRQAIRKSKEQGLTLIESDSIGDLLQFSLQQKKYLPDNQYQKLPQLWEALKQREKGMVLEVRDKAGELQTGGLFLKDTERWITIFGSNSNPENKETGAVAFMLSEAIQMAKEADGVDFFDFEGSMIEGVERFFRNFGGNPVPYLLISKNTLPKAVKWLKK
ncbi:MAG: hypothetical protein R3E32_06255 [Chitinophagales bacterium]